MATKTKTKKTTISNVSLEDAQLASESYAVAATKLSKVEAKMNEELNKVKSKYQDEITDLKEELELPIETLEVFAKEQQDKWGKKKSMELLHCVIGFRTGTPKVTKDKKFTWDAIVELVKKQKAFKPFIRTSEELNKDAILSCKDDEMLKTLKHECYIEVVQEESFYVEAKKEDLAA
jgi:phage host-nuclease inhibitor protein Gam